jgi:hypothetical protein
MMSQFVTSSAEPASDFFGPDAVLNWHIIEKPQQEGKA